MNKDLSQGEIDRLLAATENFNLDFEDDQINSAFDEAFSLKKKEPLDHGTKLALKMLCAWVTAGAPLYKDIYSGYRNYLYIYNKDFLSKLNNFKMDERAKNILLEWLDRNHTYDKKNGKKGVPMGLLLEQMTFILRSKF